MNRLLICISFCLFAISCGVVLVSCDSWELPTRKSQRECVKPAGTLTAQIQQRKVNFSISSSSGTIDQVLWDFGNNSTTATTGTTVSYSYTSSGSYTVKATLTNSCGNETILQQQISVSDAVLPTVDLQPATDVSTMSATLRMTIISTGNATITRYGVCYSATNTVPDITKDNVSDKPDAGVINTPVSFSLTALSPNTLYYARSFAVNSSGTGYSSPVQTFRTGQNPVVSVNGTATIGTTTASVNFVVTNAGNPTAVEYGIAYSSSNTTPDLTSSTTIITSPAVGVNVVVNLSNLTPNKVYNYRPYAKSPSGDVVYGAVMSFTTLVDTVTQDLIASVSFDNQSYLDVSGLNNHTIPVNSPNFTTDHRGRANSAILLDGVSEYVYMADNSSLNPDALSVSLWIKPTTVTNRMLIYNKSRFSDGTSELYSSLIKPNESGSGITINSDIKQNSNCQSGQGWQTLTFTSTPDLSQWHHIVFTYSGRAARMYFDNVLLGQTDNLPATTIDSCPGGDLKFGAQSLALPQYFKGAMDDIRLYKRALTTSEVQTLFNQ